MNFRKLFVLGVVGLSLSACAVPVYKEGRSPADVPAKVDVIRLKAMGMVSTAPELDKMPEVIAAPSQNDLEVLDIVKKTVVNQLTNYGFKIVEKDEDKADITFKVYADYVPEYGLFVHRTAIVTTYVADDEIGTLFWKHAAAMNANGLLDAMFTSRDQMVAGVAEKVTIAAVEEMRKGTKKTTPAASQTKAKETTKEESEE